MRISLKLMWLSGSTPQCFGTWPSSLLEEAESLPEIEAVHRTVRRRMSSYLRLEEANRIRASDTPVHIFNNKTKKSNLLQYHLFSSAANRFHVEICLYNRYVHNRYNDINSITILAQTNSLRKIVSLCDITGTCITGKHLVTNALCDDSP
jgi:hypothetical protein